jgi:uncharacterized protein
MITILSPAKTLDFETPLPAARYTTPAYLDEARQLMGVLREKRPEELAHLMKLSPKLTELNEQRNLSWTAEAHQRTDPARPAIFAFRGDVYRGIDADTLDAETLDFAQDHLCILSGLYGVLRPLDLILPHRLEMGTALETPRGSTLYEFWGTTIAEALREYGQPVVNLASQEYFRAAQAGGRGRARAAAPHGVGVDVSVGDRVITPVFQEITDKGPRVVAVHAKRQRGRMARFILDNRIDSPKDLRDYNLDGYRFQPEASSERELVYRR